MSLDNNDGNIMETRNPRNYSAKYNCENCDYHTSKTNDWSRHILSAKHKMATARIPEMCQNPPKCADKYNCETCDYHTSKIFFWSRHLTSEKHKKNAKPAESENTPVHNCPNCNKSYNNRAGLWKHKQKCKPKESKESKENELRNTFQENTNEVKMDMIMTLINKNTEIQNFLFEQNKKLMEQNVELSKTIHNTTTTNSNNNTNTNSNNSFNLSFFLNEQCKNAVNMNDFISSLEVTVEDLERTGKLGYVEGITAILLNGLKQLDMYTRPIHCSDLKREVLYLKNQDKWEKDDDRKTNFKKAIKSAAVKNLKQLPNWREENPECEDMDSEESEVFLVMSQKAMGGMDSKEEDKFQNSIAKNILRKVVIE